MAEHSQIAVDQVPALDSQQDCDSAGGFGPDDIGGTLGQYQVVRVEHNLPPNGLDLLEGPLDGGRPGDRSRRPDCKENRVDTPLAQAGNVHRAICVASSQIESPQTPAAAWYPRAYRSQETCYEARALGWKRRCFHPRLGFVESPTSSEELRTENSGRCNTHKRALKLIAALKVQTYVSYHARWVLPWRGGYLRGILPRVIIANFTLSS